MELFIDKLVSDSVNADHAEVRHIIENAKSGDTFVFSKKEYHFYKECSPSRIVHMTNTDSFKFPEKYFGMLFENLDDIEIQGNGATFVIHGDICAMAFLNCHNVKMSGFTVKYANPNNIEMRVQSINGRKVTFEFPDSTEWRLDGKDFVFSESSPLNGEKYWQFKNDENSDCGVCHSGDSVYRTSHAKGVFHLIKKAEPCDNSNRVLVTYRFKRNFKVGDCCTISQNHNRNTCGVFVNYCSNVSAENITVNYLAGVGWLSQMCRDISFKNVKFLPESGRTVSGFADLIHVCGCRGDVKINNCSFAHPHDDAINIHASFLRFKNKVDDCTAVFEFVHRQQGGYRAFNNGDKVVFYYRTSLQSFGGEYTVDSAVDDIVNKTVTVKFTEKLPSEIENRYKNQSNVVAENITYSPSVEISNCGFNAIPTRGILVTARGKIRIHDNEFTNVAMANVCISNDANDWYESGPVRDVEIYNNKFIVTKNNLPKSIDCSAILVQPMTFGGKVTAPVHKNIYIHSNYFDVRRDRVITAHGVENLRTEDNEYKNISTVKIN